MEAPLRLLQVGTGNTGRSHLRAYHSMSDFEVVGVCTRRPESRQPIMQELGLSCPQFNDFETALRQTQPDTVCIATYPDTHYAYTKASLEAGCHVFVEKPLAATLEEAEELIQLAAEKQCVLYVGYVLRVHPGWKRFIEEARNLGKPLVMRMNLNQQSSGESWETHKAFLQSMSPVVDCGVHYVDIMSQMTSARPLRVSGIGAQLSEELPQSKINYAQLQVTFDDGSVGWYEAGWGPMMSETAFFVKDVMGPKGSVSIVAEESASRGQSANVEAHTGTQSLLIHRSKLDGAGNFLQEDSRLPMQDEPDHDGLFALEQAAFLKAIQSEDLLPEMHQQILDSMRIVLAADQSFRTGETIAL